GATDVSSGRVTSRRRAIERGWFRPERSFVAAIERRESTLPQRFQERTHFRLAWRTPQVRRCLCLLAAAAALISTNEWRRGACHSRIKPLLAACVCAVGMWATRLRCPSEAAYPQPAGDSAVGSAAPGGGAGGRLNSLWISRRRRVGWRRQFASPSGLGLVRAARCGGEGAGSGLRSEGPSMRMVMQWCCSRSIKASTRAFLSNRSYHSGRSRLVVMMVEARL